MDEEQAVNDWADSFEVGTDEAPVETSEASVEELKEEVLDEPAEPPKVEEDEPAPKDDSEDKKPDEKQGASDDAKEGSGTAEEAGKPAEDEPKLTREDIKAVLKEAEAEKTDYVDEVKATAKEVLETFYPQGIDRQLRDKDGDPIKSIDDVMNLIDPHTGENFTEEAGARWLLERQQELNKQVEALEASAERVAEVNVNLKRDALRVVEKYGDILTKKPELATKVKTLYENTLRREKGVTLEAPVDLLTFYETMLEPYMNQATTEAPAPAPVEERPKANPEDRADLPTTGNTDTRDSDTKEWDDIAKEYQSMRN